MVAAYVLDELFSGLPAIEQSDIGEVVSVWALLLPFIEELGDIVDIAQNVLIVSINLLVHLSGFLVGRASLPR